MKVTDKSVSIEGKIRCKQLTSLSELHKRYVLHKEWRNACDKSHVFTYQWKLYTLWKWDCSMLYLIVWS